MNPPSLTPAAAGLAQELIALVRLALAVKQAGPRVDGCDPAAYPMLLPLLDGSKRVGEIACAAKADLSVASRACTALVAAGLASKSPDEHDRRAQVITITDAGRELAMRIMAHRHDLMLRALADWSASDIETLTTGLRRLRTSLDPVALSLQTQEHLRDHA